MKIYLLGAANPETVRMIRAVERASSGIEFPGFLDNDPAKHGTDFYGYPVLGGCELVAQLAGEDVRFVNLITRNTRTRHETTQQILDAGGQLTSFVHPSVDLTMTSMGTGLYLQEAVVVQAGVTVCDNASISAGSQIGHETTIGRSVFIAPAVSVCGICKIGEGTFIGTNASILPRLTIGAWATIGAGAVVNRDVPPGAVVVGNPGKILRVDELPPYAFGRSSMDRNPT